MSASLYVMFAGPKAGDLAIRFAEPEPATINHATLPQCPECGCWATSTYDRRPDLDERGRFAYVWRGADLKCEHLGTGEDQ